MAIYEYYCQSCKKKFELRRPMSQAAVVTACDCGSKAERMLSMFAAPRGGDGESLFDLGGDDGGCCGGACACSGPN